MAIDRVEVCNYTVFEEFAIDFGNGVNVIIGENGTGKTHLLREIFFQFYNEGQEDSESIGAFYRFKTLRNSCDKGYFKISGGDSTSARSIEKESTYMRRSKIPYNTAIYIPAKDMLTHSRGLVQMSKKYRYDMPFDESMLNIIDRALLWKLDEIPDIAKNIIPVLEKIMEGKIVIENDTFYVEKTDGQKIEFSSEAEGIKKIGLLWQLLMNESITKDTILLWDEPEANINPKLVPDFVDILLELSKQGVQIFIATHDYIFAKYFEVKRKEASDVIFHSLYKTDKGVKCETNVNFRDLENNLIISSFDKLLDEVYFAHVED